MTTSAESPQKIYLKDYQSPAFALDSVELFFDLQDDFCRVTTTLRVQKLKADEKDLVLDGVDLDLESVQIEGRELNPSEFARSAEQLKIFNVPQKFELTTKVKLKPAQNTSLEGLYQSGSLITTQCEAQGFRKITYFLDRPDVMTSFLVHIEADAKKFPILLSNGDRMETKVLPSGRQRVTWKDPFKKPCYLFALVAGDLGVIRDEFVTRSGKKVSLEIYSAHGTQSKCEFAMQSLKKSMKWDEERFGREYDLATYMIVAVDDFNAGAMENKGLNIFNSRLVFADAKTATDANYFAIESVIGHEYFHNWTGNRVTLRDWFHLSLKEGLTVFRDQEFSMDLHSRAMVRIDTVSDLRDGQFSEDAGPNAHPIRPESCYAVDNFFTSTIYEKGAEVIRMMQTMVGRPGFRKGMDLYFERHDGQAVIIEDFAAAIAAPNDQDWSQFKLWYSQAGTPRVGIQENYDESARTYTLKVKQSCPSTPGQSEKLPFEIPLVIGLLNSKTGQEVTLSHPGLFHNSEGQTLLRLKKSEEVFEFKNIHARPVLSINRGFSAPIQLDWEAREEDLLFLLSNDSDAFNRWEAAQKLMLQDLLQLSKDSNRKPSDNLQAALAQALESPNLDLNLKSKLLSLPSDSYLSQWTNVFEPAHIERARLNWEQSFAEKYESVLLAIYEKYHGKNDQSLHHTHMAERRLKNSALSFLSLLKKHENLLWKQLAEAAHMTDFESAMSFCVDLEGPKRDEALRLFLEKWKDDSITMNKWFALQALSRHPKTAETVQALWSHPTFNRKNPNRVYSLLGRFGDNLIRFHEKEGKNYTWMAEKILELDRINPQVATRVSGAFDLCTKMNETTKAKARSALNELLQAGLSKNTYEIVSKSYAALG